MWLALERRGAPDYERPVRLTAITIHPIKSCGGVPLERARVELPGLALDRRFMLVDAQNEFVSQRSVPALARVRVSLDGDELVVAAAGASELRLASGAAPGAAERVRVWGSETVGVEVPHASAWFSELLSDAVRLVRMPDEALRPVDPDYGKPGDRVSYADGFPLLLVSEASLAALNERLDAPVEMRRFRPNLVISGVGPHAEDTFECFRIGDVGFRAVKPCSRCVMVTHDPDTGEAGREPLATLARHRSRDGKVYFGMNVIPDACGEVAVGDRILL